MREHLLVVVVAGWAAACSSDLPSTGTTGSPLSFIDLGGGNLYTQSSAGDGWGNAFVPQQSGSFRVEWDAASVDTLPIDAVMGFSNGPADSFSDLGPIARFRPDGTIDARNGDHYAADASFDYTESPSWITMYVDVASRTYTVTAHHDAQDDETQIATNYAFRSEQAGLARIDNLGWFVDGDAGTLQLSDVYFWTLVCTRSGALHTWAGAAIPAQRGHFQIEIDIDPLGYGLDAVIGLAPQTPTAFSQLAAAVRLNADGYFDVRDGSGYRADATVAYDLARNYHVVFDVDVPNHRYSVSLPDPWNPIALATNYAFRTEQANATSLASLGQIIDSTDPDDATALITCDLMARY